jgi:hypothetical protein
MNKRNKDHLYELVRSGDVENITSFICQHNIEPYWGRNVIPSDMLASIQRRLYARGNFALSLKYFLHQSNPPDSPVPIIRELLVLKDFPFLCSVFNHHKVGDKFLPDLVAANATLPDIARQALAERVEPSLVHKNVSFFAAACVHDPTLLEPTIPIVLQDNKAILPFFLAILKRTPPTAPLPLEQAAAAAPSLVAASNFDDFFALLAAYPPLRDTTRFSAVDECAVARQWLQQPNVSIPDAFLRLNALGCVRRDGGIFADDFVAAAMRRRQLGALIPIAKDSLFAAEVAAALRRETDPRAHGIANVVGAIADKSSYPLCRLLALKEKVVFVNSPETVRIATDALRNASILGIDREAKPNFVKGGRSRCALLQVATREGVFIFDLIALNGAESSALSDAFANPKVIKVALGLREDLRNLRISTPGAACYRAVTSVVDIGRA